uniref:21. class VI heat shock protein n=1 Tax=Anthurium amnicola TaxID=1678845 RepID=A0A1D1XUJ2_9ARAE
MPPPPPPPPPPSRQALQVRPGDHSPRKWCMSLREDVFGSFIGRGGDTVRAVFGEGSLFSPMLFGRFFDPADAFPLWDFESEVLLAGLRDAVKSRVDWSETDMEYVFRAELPGIVKNDLIVSFENGRVIEISGQWRGGESNRKDWRTEHWWEYGYVRRLELPEAACLRKTVAYIEDDVFLEIKIPKNASGSNGPEASSAEKGA